jgi:hypothetical protein
MVSLARIIPNEWYISIVCNCGERLLLFQDLTRGNGSLAGSFFITCPSCGERGCYPAQHYKYELEENRCQPENAQGSLSTQAQATN